MFYWRLLEKHFLGEHLSITASESWFWVSGKIMLTFRYLLLLFIIFSDLCFIEMTENNSYHVFLVLIYRFCFDIELFCSKYLFDFKCKEFEYKTYRVFSGSVWRNLNSFLPFYQRLDWLGPHHAHTSLSIALPGPK